MTPSSPLGLHQSLPWSVLASKLSAAQRERLGKFFTKEPLQRRRDRQSICGLEQHWWRPQSCNRPPVPERGKQPCRTRLSFHQRANMSDDEADPELLALLRQSLGLGPGSAAAPLDTGVRKSAEFIYDNAIDVSISSPGTKAAAETIWKLMKERDYSTRTWSEHELHPKVKNESSVNFIFMMNLLNFSFWSTKPEDRRFAVEYRGQRWTGYWSLVAALQRGLDEGQFPVT